MTNKKINWQDCTSFEICCEKTGRDPKVLPDVSMIDEGFRDAIIGVYKLMVAHEAVNEGWEPDWNNWHQTKYYYCPEIKASKEVPSGFGFSHSGHAGWNTNSDAGSRLASESHEKAMHLGKYFKKQYMDFFLKKAIKK